jgi:hypothetical protein
MLDHKASEWARQKRDLRKESEMARQWGPSRILLALAVLAFVLAALGVGLGNLDLIAIGLALGFASFLL